MAIERYAHHGREVSVQSHVKGRHRDFCLCWQNCARFRPGLPTNCPIADEHFAFCKKHTVTAPVFECPQYLERKE